VINATAALESFMILGYQTLKDHGATHWRTASARTEMPHSRLGKNEAFPGQMAEQGGCSNPREAASCGVTLTTPLLPVLRSGQRLFQESPAKREFLTFNEFMAVNRSFGRWRIHPLQLAGAPSHSIIR